MHHPTALRQRTQLATLLTTILHAARRSPTWHEPDRRHLRRWQHLLLALLIQRSTRLLALAHVLLPLRRGTSIKTVAQGIGAFLRSPHGPLAPLSPALLAATLAQLDPTRLVRAHAARRLGSADSGWQAAETPWHPLDRIFDERMVADTRAKLGEAAFEAAWVEGRAMLLEQGVAYALDLLSTFP